MAALSTLLRAARRRMGASEFGSAGAADSALSSNRAQLSSLRDP
jgi:hypothetical protein